MVKGPTGSCPGDTRRMSSTPSKTNPPERAVVDDALAARLKKPKRRPTPSDALRLARRKWLLGHRLDVGLLAGELGIGRATLFRWIGSRENLYGEVLSGIYAEQRLAAERESEGRGADRVADAHLKTLTRLLAAAPLRTFIENDPEFAIRVLTSKSSPAQSRAIELELSYLRRLRESGEIDPVLDLETLAYIIIRIGEAFLYGDVISGVRPDMEKAAAAIRILVAAESKPMATALATALTPPPRIEVD